MYFEARACGPRLQLANLLGNIGNHLHSGMVNARCFDGSRDHWELLVKSMYFETRAYRPRPQRANALESIGKHTNRGLVGLPEDAPSPG